jgi:ABC-type multidrug transport system fused ATPase/permease subunit
MNQSKPIPLLLYRLWGHVPVERRKQFLFILVLTALTTFAEILSIGSALPFLAALTAPEHLFQNFYLQNIFKIIGISSPHQLLLPLTIGFGLAALLAGCMRLILLWASTRLSYAIGADLSISIYRRTLYQPYAVHCSRNSSEIIAGISTKANTVIGITTHILNLISSCFILMSILITLLFIDPNIAISIFLGFGSIYLLVIVFTRKKQLVFSRQIARESTQVIKSLQEGLGGIRDVLIDGSQTAYCKIYSEADSKLRWAQGNNIFIASSPRYVVEALGMILIAAVSYYLAKEPSGIERAIPVLGVLALGAQRLLPLLQQAYGAWAGIRGEQASLQDTLGFLDQALPIYLNQESCVAVSFEQSISVDNLSFRYSNESPWVFEKLSFSIPKGGRIGFIGETGSGKSTLIDILMGLLEPSFGSLRIDGKVVSMRDMRSWQAHIAHVPQAIYLADASVAENIAFGLPFEKIDMAKIKNSARRAQIASVIENWPNEYNTLVGERGIRLSGGQRQRICIARALYKDADVIIFDEATSALDGETELAVMQAIENLSNDLTILIIAHRITTLKGCTQIIELGGGGIKRFLKYQDIKIYSQS